jgi:multiple sugar transport system permease protein
MKPAAQRRSSPSIDTGGVDATGDNYVGWLAATPAVLLMIAILFGPLVAVILFSLTDWQLGASTYSFVGLANFRALFDDPIFVKSLLNTGLYVLMVVPVTVFLGLLVAILIESSDSLRRFYRAAHFLPVMAATSAMALVWGTMLHPTIGLINRLVEFAGFTGINWLRDERTALMALAVVGIWQSFGFAMVLFISGLKTIPQNLYDAAAIDGADRAVERLRAVTLPMLGPVMMFVVIVTAARAFAVFDIVRVLTQGAPNYATDVLLNRLYTESFDYLRTGYGAALTVVYLSIIVALTLIQAKLIEQRVHYS